jgi:hypothetical protein
MFFLIFPFSLLLSYSAYLAWHSVEAIGIWDASHNGSNFCKVIHKL